MRSPALELPPWEARNDRDCRAMIDWTIGQLMIHDREELEALDAQQQAGEQIVSIRRPGLEAAKEDARRGHLQPLRALYPEIAEFINEPQRRRGQRRPYTDPYLEFGRRAQGATLAADIKQIRQIWQTHYGRWKRRAGDGPSAEAIAGERWGLTEDQVRQALKQAARSVQL